VNSVSDGTMTRQIKMMSYADVGKHVILK